MKKTQSILSKLKVKSYYQGEELHTLLNQIYEEKKKVNPRFSIRSFARLIEVDQSLLTKVLKGQRSLSSENARRCLEILKADQVAVKLNPIKKIKKINFQKLNDSMFEMISDWEYFAVLEMFHLKDVTISEDFVSQKMGLTLERATQILKILLDTNFIKRSQNSYILSSGDTSWAPGINERTSEAKKNLQKKLLQKSIASLDADPLEIRDHSSVTLAIKKSELPLLKTTLKDVRRQLTEMFQKSGDFDEVYQITISLFPLTK
jgi:uncharacterized protein (TIGR02147 family)